MRIPVTPQISIKDGTSNKNARLTNCLKESKKSGDKAVVRPGLVLDAQATGIGNGVVAFNNELVSVYGSTLGLNTATSGGGWELWVSGIQYIYVHDNAIGRVGNLGIGGDTDNENFYYYRINADLSITRLNVGWPVGLSLSIGCNTATGFLVYWDDGIEGIRRFFTDGVTEDYSYYITIDLDGKTLSTLDFVTAVPVTNTIVIGLTLSDAVRYYYTSSDGITFTLGGTLPANGPFLVMVNLGTTIYSYNYNSSVLGISETHSTDGYTWSTRQALPGLVESPISVFSQGGKVYMWFYLLDDLYSSTDGTTFTLESENVFGSAIPSYVWGDGTDLYLIKSDSGDVWKETASSASIPALATISGNYYDFAQSPL